MTCDENWAGKVARIALAGRIAEMRSENKRASTAGYIGSDLRNTQAAWQFGFPGVMSEEAQQAWLKAQWVQARDLVVLQWRDIELIAAALLERETLSGADVDALLALPEPPAPSADAATPARALRRAIPAKKW